MLAAVVLTVTPVEACTAPAYTGRAVQAWFLDLVRAHSPTLSDALHAGDGPRPYTVSSLIGAGPVRDGQRQLVPDRSGWVRLTTLNGELSGLLVEQILPALPGSLIDLSGATVRVDAVATSQAEHSWAGQSTAQSLLAGHSLDTHASRRLTMRFSSPTTFRSQGKNIPFPQPELVFGSLVNRWNAFMQIALHPDARQFAEERIVASKYQLRSRYVEFAGGQRGAAVGCLGSCRYYVQSSDRYWRGVIRTLAAFAFFAGVGARTAAGLGQAALWDEESRQPII